MESTERLEHEDVGYLSIKEWNRARWAAEYALKFLPWLRIAGYVRFEVEDVRVDSSGGAGIGIPPTKLAYIEINRLLGELNRWTELEDAANDMLGQFLLASLGREMSTAVARWPMEDRPHRVDAMRCGGCEQLTLTYRPPRWEGDEIRVDCYCGYVLNHDEFERSVALIELEQREAS